MKKLIYSALALGSIFGVASCSSDGPDAPVVGDGATFTIRLPRDMQTRATFGDQSKVTLNNLQWTIYDCTSGTPTLVQSGSKANAFAASQTEEQVTLPLVKGHKYQVTFYADNAENAYATYTDGKVNVDYSLGKSNDREEDCFVGKSTQITVTGGFNETVTLTRPYSQLNWGTNDLGAGTVQAIMQGLLANVKVSGLYKTMDVLTGEFSDPVGEAVSFPNVDMNSLPAETFPVEGYTLIAMNYLLCGNGTVDCSLNFNNGVDAVVVNQAPVKVNYRTNIYGSLLTAPGQFNIIVDPNWDGDINVMGWDGTSVTIPEGVDDPSATILITHPAELAGLAKVVNDGNSLKGRTVKLQNDLDLGGKTWTSIGNSSSKPFEGTFNGNGKNISNLAGNSLFGYIQGGASVSSLYLGNVAISGGYFSSSIGSAVGYATDATVNDVHVLSGKVSGYGMGGDGVCNGIGGVVGTMAYTGTISNCSSAATVTASNRFGGGIVGAATGTKTGQDNIKITNCTNTGNVGTTSSGHWMGGIAGVSSADVSGCTNSGAIAGNNESIGGICGEQRVFGSVTNCTNSGTVTNNSGKYGTGGIVGYVRYYKAASAGKSTYEQQGLISVNSNTNTAAISGGVGVGGIVGIWFQYGYCNNNKNYAPSISASGQWPAGICGAFQRMDGNDYNIVNVPADAKFWIENNITSTTLDQMTGNMKSLFFYDNIGDKVVATGNTTTF